jgi:hypothetical protein
MSPTSYQAALPRGTEVIITNHISMSKENCARGIHADENSAAENIICLVSLDPQPGKLI